MPLRVLFKSRVWELLFCTAASAALAYAVFTGYHAGRAVQGNLVLLVGVPLAITAVLCLVTRSTATAIVGGAAVAAVLVGVLVACAAAAPQENFLDDQAGNPFYVAAVLAACSVGVFVLARRRATCVVLLVCGLFACALMEYLYWQGHLVSALVFGISAAGLIAYRTYQASLLSSESEGLSFGPVSGVGVAIPLAGVLCALGVFFGVIAPLDPGHLEVKLITQHYRSNVVEVKGVESVLSLLDYDRTSDVADKRTEEASESDETEEEQTSDDPTTERDDGTKQNARAASAGTGDGYDRSDLHAIGLEEINYLALIIAALAVALVVGVVVGKKRLRERRFRQMMSQPNEDAARALYLFFVKRLERFKITKPENQTLSEFCSSGATQLGAFEQAQPGQPVAFAGLTDLYARAAYGSDRVSDEEMGQFESYYRNFYRNARKYVGRLRYLRHFLFV